MNYPVIFTQAQWIVIWQAPVRLFVWNNRYLLKHLVGSCTRLLIESRHIVCIFSFYRHFHWLGISASWLTCKCRDGYYRNSIMDSVSHSGHIICWGLVEMFPKKGLQMGKSMRKSSLKMSANFGSHCVSAEWRTWSIFQTYIHHLKSDVQYHYRGFAMWNWFSHTLPSSFFTLI